MLRLALAVALLSLAVLQGTSAQSQCYGVSFNTYADGFRYDLYLNLNGCSSSQVKSTPEEALLYPKGGATGCPSSDVVSRHDIAYIAYCVGHQDPILNLISRLVMQGACSNQRDNNFGGYPKCSNGGSNLVSSSSSSCNTFFSQAPSSAIVRRPGSGTYDSGKICSNSDNAYVYVQTTCSSFTASQVRLTTYGYGSGFCFDGHTLSAGAVAGIAIGCAVVVFVIVFVAIRYGCRRRRTTVVQTGPGINMQPYPPAAPYNQPPSYGAPYQGYQNQGYPNQGYPSQGYPAQGYPQGYPQQPAGKF